MNRKPVFILYGCTLALLLLFAAGQPAAAGGVVGSGTPLSCTEAALDAALAGGGPVTFNCGPSPRTITLSRIKNVTADTSLDGGGRITLSGGQAVGVFSVYPGAYLSLVNLTIRDGRVISGSGGGVANNGRLTVVRCAFIANQAGFHGGAILNYGTATIIDSRFESNQAGINGGAIDSTVQLTVQRSMFTENSARFRGGAINNYLGTMTVEESLFADNRSAGYGGGLVNDGGTALIQTSRLLRNTAPEVGGGIKNSGILNVLDSTFSGNSADTRGGGIENTEASSAFVSNSTFSGNHSRAGGGISNLGTLALINTTVAGNSGSTEGGGIGNMVADGANATTTFVNTIVADNTAPQGANCWAGGGTLTSQGYNLENANTCNFGLPTDHPNTNPLLAALAGNGGLTETRALLSGSPAIDAGNTSVCAAWPVNGQDQRGVSRWWRGRACDIGAYEFNSLFRIYLPWAWSRQ